MTRYLYPLSNLIAYLNAVLCSASLYLKTQFAIPKLNFEFIIRYLKSDIFVKALLQVRNRSFELKNPLLQFRKSKFLKYATAIPQVLNY